MCDFGRNWTIIHAIGRTHGRSIPSPINQSPQLSQTKPIFRSISLFLLQIRPHLRITYSLHPPIPLQTYNALNKPTTNTNLHTPPPSLQHNSDDLLSSPHSALSIALRCTMRWGTGENGQMEQNWRHYASKGEACTRDGEQQLAYAWLLTPNRASGTPDRPQSPRQLHSQNAQCA